MNTELLPAEGTILCAVSGGADSMYLLERLRQLGYPVAAAHFDHGLRGDDSARDAAFVREYCLARDIPFVCGAGDTASYARENRLGIEEAARELRYAFLDSAADELGAAVIATAHTADDNAETILLRLARGAGLKGLGGIPPVRGRIVRPMLGVTRAEVEDYLRERGVSHVEDATNAEDEYARNRVRHHVIPALRAENPALAETIARTARLLREDEDYLDGLARVFLEKKTDGDTLPTEALLALPRPVARRVVRLMAGEKTTLGQTERILALARDGGSADIPGMRVTVSEGKLRFGTQGSTSMPERIVRPGDELILPEAGLLLRCDKIDVFPGVVYKSFNTFYTSCEKIRGPIRVTSRRPGDSYRPAGRGCTKTLKALFMENDVPTWERDRIPILRDDEGILGVYGMPAAERAAAGPGDTDIICLKFSRLRPEGKG